MKWTKPSRTWVTAQVTATGAWIVALIQAGWEVNTTLQITAVGIVVQAVTSYGVKEKDALSRRARSK